MIFVLHLPLEFRVAFHERLQCFNRDTLIFAKGVSLVKYFFIGETGGAVALVRLGKLLQDRRGNRGIRDVAEEIGISAPTLSRVERGKLLDLLTFKKICAWLKVSPSEFLDLPPEDAKSTTHTASVAVHFKADNLLSPEAASDFGQLILVAQEEALRNS